MSEELRRFIAIYLTRQFVVFLAVGGAAAFLHWLARIGLNVYFDYMTSVVLAYIVGLASAYVLNRIYVFPRSSRAMSQEITMFTIVNLAAFPVVVGVAYVASELILIHIMPVGPARLLGHGAGVLSPVLVNFAAHKFWTFKEG